jgi:hypothetical protein
MRDMVDACNILVGKYEGKRSLGRRRYRWEDNIKTYLRETDVDWSHVAQDVDH